MGRFRAHHRLAMGLGVVALLVVAAGCGDDDDDEAGGGGGGDSGGSGGGGTLTVCTDSPYPPMELEQDGEFTGFDIELTREIASRLDMEFDVRDVTFDTILLSLESDECNVVASSMSITPEREEQVLFSDPYFDADQSMLVRAEDAETYPDLESLEGQTIGTQCETTGDTYANDNKPEGATVQCFTETDPMFLALESGEVAALFQDLVANVGRAAENENLAVTGTYETDEQYGLALAQDDQDLVDQINEQLQAMRDDGTYDQLYEEWIGSLIAD
jgi:polar amino acid transport system substrate-binding protein